jgi:hypothetical protein
MGNEMHMIVDQRTISRQTRPQMLRKLACALTCAAVVAGLAGCGASSEGDGGGSLTTAAPVALTPQRTDMGGDTALIAPVDEAELRKAIERYRISKNRGEANVDNAGVDLNGDGKPEALVLFAGADWCLQTGCSLVVFQLEATGYRPVSHVTRVRPPIMVGPDNNFGWNDLLVQTGGGPSPVRTVRLGFTGNGYPGNALLQPEPLIETVSRSQGVLAESTGFSAYSRQAAAQPESAQ